MKDLSKETVQQAMAAYQDPYLGGSLLHSGWQSDISISDDLLQVRLQAGFPLGEIQTEIEQGLRHLIVTVAGSRTIKLELSWQVVSTTVGQNLPAIDGVKNIFAVASGKGGVGKSTTTVNMAAALQQAGARVGILDADIYGPSQPQMLGINTHPESKGEHSMQPVMSHGLQSMSIGYLVDVDTPMIWRGPMVSGALQQLLKDTNWDNLDYLFIDLPPGTGDIQLTLAQKVPVSGAIIVTTPQDLALLDVKRAVAMFNQVKVPVLGVVENMTTHKCSQCGYEEAIFGKDGAEKIARQFSIPVLGKLPLDIRIRQQSDKGAPIVVQEPSSPLAESYRAIALRAAASLFQQASEPGAGAVKIIIE